MALAEQPRMEDVHPRQAQVRKPAKKSFRKSSAYKPCGNGCQMAVATAPQLPGSHPSLPKSQNLASFSEDLGCLCKRESALFLPEIPPGVRGTSPNKRRVAGLGEC